MKTARVLQSILTISDVCLSARLLKASSFCRFIMASSTPKTARQEAICAAENENDSRWAAVVNGDTTGFEVCHVEGIGRGIRTTKSFKQGDLLLRYFGELISPQELKRRERVGPERGCFYRYLFKVVRYGTVTKPGTVWMEPEKTEPLPAS